MKIGIFSEHLGNVSTELLLQNLTNDNPHVSSIDSIRYEFPLGFTVHADFERSYFETDTEEVDAVQAFEAMKARVMQAETVEQKWEAVRNGNVPLKHKKLLRLVLTPIEAPGGEQVN